MAQNNFIVISLALTVAFLAYANAVTKEDCMIQCTIQYNSLAGRTTEIQRQNILTQCQASCNSLLSATTPKTTATGTGNSNTGTGTAGTKTKEQCQQECKTQATNLKSVTEVIRASVLTTCLTTCEKLPSSTSTSTGGQTQTVTFAQCEKTCENQVRILKAKGTYPNDFIENRVYPTCKTQCLTLVPKSGGVSDVCRNWVTKLREMYARDPQAASFLQTLESRATQACA